MKSNLAPTKSETLTKLLNSRLHHLIPPDSMKISNETRQKYIKYLENAELGDIQRSPPMGIEDFLTQQK